MQDLRKLRENPGWKPERPEMALILREAQQAADEVAKEALKEAAKQNGKRNGQR